MTEPASIDRAAISALIIKLHSGKRLTAAERQILSGVLIAIEIQLDSDHTGEYGEAHAWSSIRRSVARKFPTARADAAEAQT